MIQLGINIQLKTSLSHSHPTKSKQAPLLKLRLNSTLQTRRLGGTSPAALHLTILANQELLKVPLDALQTHEPGLLVLHPRPHGLFRSAGFAVHFDFAEHFVGHFVAEDAEVLDFFVGAWVLATELVAGEGEDFEVFGVRGFDICEGGEGG
jgi:hypothetical protein